MPQKTVDSSDIERLAAQDHLGGRIDGGLSISLPHSLLDDFTRNLSAETNEFLRDKLPRQCGHQVYLLRSSKP